MWLSFARLKIQVLTDLNYHRILNIWEQERKNWDSKYEASWILVYRRGTIGFFLGQYIEKLFIFGEENYNWDYVSDNNKRQKYLREESYCSYGWNNIKIKNIKIWQWHLVTQRHEQQSKRTEVDLLGHLNLN